MTSPTSPSTSESSSLLRAAADPFINYPDPWNKGPIAPPRAIIISPNAKYPTPEAVLASYSPPPFSTHLPALFFTNTPSQPQVLRPQYHHQTLTSSPQPQTDLPLLLPRAVIRAAWIEHTAKRISDLCKFAYLANHRFLSSRNPDDYLAWRRLQEKLDSVLDLETCLAERRALFRPLGGVGAGGAGGNGGNGNGNENGGVAVVSRDGRGVEGVLERVGWEGFGSGRELREKREQREDGEDGERDGGEGRREDLGGKEVEEEKKDDVEDEDWKEGSTEERLERLTTNEMESLRRLFEVRLLRAHKGYGVIGEERKKK